MKDAPLHALPAPSSAPMWEMWTAYGTWALFVATIVLAGVALWQILEIRSENRKQRTLQACLLYISDPVIDASARAIRRAEDTKEIDQDPRKYRVDVVTILNFFDLLATGIQQGLYADGLARDHLEPILRGYCTKYLNSAFLEKIGLSETYYILLFAMARRWKALPE